MLRPVIDYEACRSCDPCEAKLVCKTRAIVKLDPDETPYIALERCSGCSACIGACAYGVIHMRLTGVVAGGRPPNIP